MCAGIERRKAPRGRTGVDERGEEGEEEEREEGHRPAPCPRDRHGSGAAAEEGLEWTRSFSSAAAAWYFTFNHLFFRGIKFLCGEKDFAGLR
jgi:hypothetical protein